MSEVLEHSEGPSSSSDRRKHSRQRIHSLAYVELDQDNGGIILDASESGISVQAVVSLIDDELPKMRVKLPHSKDWLETRAQIVWTREARKVAGLQFLDLPDEARDWIKEWLSREASGVDTNAEYSVEPAAEAAEPLAKGATPGRELENGGIPPSPVPVADSDQPNASLPMGNAQPAGSESQSAAKILSVPVLIEPSTFQAAEPREKHSAGAPEQQSRAQISAPKPVHEWKNPRLASIYLLLVVLALLSLTAGWAAGSGRFGLLARKLRPLAPQAGIEQRTRAGQMGRPVAPVNYIEIVDANSQQWTIPLKASPRENSPAPTAAPTSALVPESQPALNFQIWTLSAPKRGELTGSANPAMESAPPAVDEHGAAPEIGSAANPILPDSSTVLPKPWMPSGVLKRGALIHRVEPVYPDLAKQAHVEGTVMLNATIGPDGAVRRVRAVSGSKLLSAAAIDAVRQWKYAPTLLDGKPVESEVEISLVFRLMGSR